MHVRGLPALHDGLAHDLEVGVGLIVAGARVVPGRLAVLPLGEDRQCGAGHDVCLRVEQAVLVIDVDGLCLHTEEGGRYGPKVYKRGPEVLTRQEVHQGSTSAA